MKPQTEMKIEEELVMENVMRLNYGIRRRKKYIYIYINLEKSVSPVFLRGYVSISWKEQCLM